MILSPQTKPTASQVTYTSGGGISAEDLQNAVAELDAEAIRSSTLSAPTGSNLIGYLPQGTNATATTIQNKLRESISIKDFGATGSGLDETSLVQAALNSGAKRVTIPSNMTVGVTSLTLATNQSLEINGTLKKLSGTSPIIIMSSSSKVTGTGEIDGNSVSCDGIFSSANSFIEVSGLYIHHIGKKGIAQYTSGSGIKIHNNRLANIGEQAISVEYVQGASITNNIIDTALHGIQWWGGDSNISNTPGTFAINISNNLVTNVMGGIWGSLGQNISVVNNHVENCSDVGIDFEGCLDFTCTGNTAYECANGCYAVFFGSKRGTFSGNAARNVISNGSGFYATTNATYKNENLVISNNTFSTKGTCLYADQNSTRSLSNSIITSNNFISSGGSSAIQILQNEKLRITDNSITTIGSKIGVQLQSVSYSVISNNMIYGFSDPSTAPNSSGGIWLYQQSSTQSSQYNTIRNNRIDSYVYSIVDECPSDQSKSNNDIQHNSLTNVYRTTGASYNGVIANNLYIYSPSTAVSPSTF